MGRNGCRSVVVESVMSVQSGSGVGVGSDGAESDLDLSALGVALWRKKWLILIPTLLVAVVDAGGGEYDHADATNPKPRSRSRAARTSSCVRRPKRRSIAPPPIRKRSPLRFRSLQSRDIARQVIRELKLGERPEFDPVLSGVSSLGAFLSAIGLGRDRLKMTPEERVMEVYFDRLTVSAVERSRVITIEFQSAIRNCRRRSSTPSSTPI